MFRIPRFISAFAQETFDRILKKAREMDFKNEFLRQEWVKREGKRFYLRYGETYKRVYGRGTRECERRRLQIENGSLRAQNGLVLM